MDIDITLKLNSNHSEVNMVENEMWHLQNVCSIRKNLAKCVRIRRKHMVNMNAIITNVNGKTKKYRNIYLNKKGLYISRNKIIRENSQHENIT